MNKIIPKCKFGKTSYIAASGKWLPCCSFPDHGKQLEKSIFNSEEYNIDNNDDLNAFYKKQSFIEWIKFIENNYDSNLSICKERCSSIAHDIQKQNKNVNWTMEEVVFINNKFNLDLFLSNHDIDQYDDDLFAK